MKLEFRLKSCMFVSVSVFNTVVMGFFPNVKADDINGGYIDFWFSDSVLNVGYVNFREEIIAQVNYQLRPKGGAENAGKSEI